MSTDKRSPDGNVRDHKSSTISNVGIRSAKKINQIELSLWPFELCASISLKSIASSTTECMAYEAGQCSLDVVLVLVLFPQTFA